MKKDYIKIINEALTYLPEKDYLISIKLFNNRNLENLQELVDSSIIRIRNERKKEIPVKYKDVNLERLLFLKAELDIYVELVLWPLTNDEEDEKEFN